MNNTRLVNYQRPLDKYKKYKSVKSKSTQCPLDFINIYIQICFKCLTNDQKIKAIFAGHDRLVQSILSSSSSNFAFEKKNNRTLSLI